MPPFFIYCWLQESLCTRYLLSYKYPSQDISAVSLALLMATAGYAAIASSAAGASPAAGASSAATVTSAATVAAAFGTAASFPYKPHPSKRCTQASLPALKVATNSRSSSRLPLEMSQAALLALGRLAPSPLAQPRYHSWYQLGVAATRLKQQSRIEG